MAIKSKKTSDSASQAFLYQTIYRELRQQILDGKILPGERLPAERDLLSNYGVSRATVRQALSLLEEEGLVRRKRCSGCYVLPLSQHSSQNSVTLHMGIVNALDNSISRVQLRFAHRVKELTRGRLIIEIHPKSSLGTVPQQLNMVKKSKLDMFSGDQSYLELFDRRWVACNLPFLYQNISQLQHYSQSAEHQDLNSQLIDQHRVRKIGPSWPRPPHLLMADRPCYTLDDFKKLKILSIDTETMKIFCAVLGAQQVPGIPSHCFDEYYDQGKVNSLQESRLMVGSKAFHKKLPFLLLTDHIYSQTIVLISQKSYSKLRFDLRDAMLQASEEISQSYYRECQEDWTMARDLLLKDGCHLIRSNIDRFRQRTIAWVEEHYASEPQLISLSRQIAEMAGGNSN